MKNLLYGLLVLAALSIQLIEACPFTFVNDGTKKVFIHDMKNNKKYYAAAGKSVRIPGAVANEPTLWIYTETAPASNIFNPVYGVNEDECMPAGSPAATLRWSQLAGLATSHNLHEGLRIESYNKDENPTVAAEVTYRDLRSSY